MSSKTEKSVTLNSRPNMCDTFLVVGPPGCGKTTYIVRQANRALQRYCEESGSLSHNSTDVLFTTMTRAAAAELKDRELDLSLRQVATLHSHARRALIDAGETITLFDTNDMLIQWNLEHQAKYKMQNVVEEEQCRVGIDVDKYPGDDRRSTYAIHRARLIPRDKWKAPDREFAEVYERFKEQEGCIDYSDIIDNAFELTTCAPGDPRAIFVDECQDLDKSQFRLLLHWARRAEKIVLVGDSRQAVYRWRGSDPEAMNSLDIPPANKIILGQSHRVPRSVHHVATKIIKRCADHEAEEYLPRPVEGTVTYMKNLTLDPRRSDSVAKLIQDMTKEGNVMMLAQSIYMLWSLIYELRAQAIPFHNPYSRNRSEYNPLSSERPGSACGKLLAFLRPNQSIWGDEARLWSWLDVKLWLSPLRAEGLLKRGQKIALLSAVGEMGKADRGRPVTKDWLQEAFEPEALASMTDQSGDVSWEWYKKRMKGVVPKTFKYVFDICRKHGPSALLKEPKVIIGTIHSVKGGEADTVIVAPDMSPACEVSFMVDPDETTMLFYVACTRAKTNLILLRYSGRSKYTFLWPTPINHKWKHPGIRVDM